MKISLSRAAACAVVAISASMLSGCKAEAPAAVPTAPPEVTVSQPVEREIADFLEFTGRTESPQVAEIRARVSGHLHEIKFSDGQEVKVNDLLFQIDPRPFDATAGQAKAEVERAEAMVLKETAEAARREQLLKKKAIAPEELERAIAQKAVAASEKAIADQKLVKAQLDVEFARIKAPIAGRVSRANTTIGNLISPNEGPSGLLTTIVSVDPMYVYFNVDEQALLRYKAEITKKGLQLKFTHIKELKLPVTVALTSEAGFTHQGLLDFVDNQVNTSTGSIRARAEMPNKDRTFVPGLFVRVRLPFGDVHKEFVVPDRAISTDQNLRYLLVVNDKNEVERRDVTLGSLSKGERVIKTGLKAGEWVIVNGMQRAKPGATVKPQRK